MVGGYERKSHRRRQCDAHPHPHAMREISWYAKSVRAYVSRGRESNNVPNDLPNLCRIDGGGDTFYELEGLA